MHEDKVSIKTSSNIPHYAHLTYRLCEGGATEEEDEGGADVDGEADHCDQVGRHPERHLANHKVPPARKFVANDNSSNL